MAICPLDYLPYLDTVLDSVLECFSPSQMMPTHSYSIFQSFNLSNLSIILTIIVVISSSILLLSTCIQLYAT